MTAKLIATGDALGTSPVKLISTGVERSTPFDTRGLYSTKSNNTFYIKTCVDFLARAPRAGQQLDTIKKN